MKIKDALVNNQMVSLALQQENRDLRARIIALETENTNLSLMGIDLEAARANLRWKQSETGFIPVVLREQEIGG